MTRTSEVFMSRGQARGGVTTDITNTNIVLYTVDQMFGGLIRRNCNGAARADFVPSASAMIAGLPGCVVGTTFEFTLKNISPAAETITVTANVGVTLSGTMTIATVTAKRFRVEVTNATPGQEAYTLDSLGAASAY